MRSIDGDTGAQFVAPDEECGELRRKSVEVEDPQSGFGLEPFVQRDRRLVSEPQHAPHGACGIFAFKLWVKPGRRSRLDPIRLQGLERRARAMKAVKAFEFNVAASEHAQSLNCLVYGSGVRVRCA